MIKTDTSTPHYCASCKEEIHPEAKKCPSCGSFQNWRRHLGLSSSFLSVLLALISVSTVFTTVIANSGKPNDSDIKASIMEWQRISKGNAQILAVETFITNSGQRPGIVRHLSVKAKSDKEFEHLKNKIYAANGTDTDTEQMNSTIVEAGDSVLVRKYFTTLLSAEEFKEKYSTVDLLIQVSNFSGKPEDIIIAIRDREPEYYR